jgi:hypothetical protein
MMVQMKDENTSIDKLSENEKDRMMAMVVLAIHESVVALQDVSGQCMEARSCPPPEVLAAFTSGSLDQNARPAVVSHLDRCERCYREVVQVVLAQDVLDSEKEDRDGR